MGLTSDPHDPNLRKHDDRGMQLSYLVLSEEERAKGFVEPVRNTYFHAKCGTHTWMAQGLAETYARSPEFYTGTWCGGCGTHVPVGENGDVYWVENDQPTDQKVGTRRVRP